MNIELNIDDLAYFIFVQNKNEAPIDLQLHGIKDTRDLFCFCIDLLSKGLIHVCHKDSVDIDEVSEEEFAILSRKMKTIGIQVHLFIEDNIKGQQACIDMGDEYKVGLSTCLNSYKFSIITSKKIYAIWFQI